MCTGKSLFCLQEKLNLKHIHLGKLSDENGSFPDPTEKFIAKDFCGTCAPQHIEIVRPLPLDDKDERGQVHSEHSGRYNFNLGGSTQEALENKSDQGDLGSEREYHSRTSFFDESGSNEVVNMAVQLYRHRFLELTLVLHE